MPWSNQSGGGGGGGGQGPWGGGGGGGGKPPDIEALLRKGQERMRGMIANHLRRAGMDDGEEASEFLDSLPELLDETIAHVTNAEVDGFIERSLEAAAGAVEAYLK